MAIEQTSHGCQVCKKYTMHQMTTKDTPHVIYLILTIFCCGWVLPIWLLHIAINSMETGYWVCCQCGNHVAAPSSGLMWFVLAALSLITLVGVAIGAFVMFGG